MVVIVTEGKSDIEFFEEFLKELDISRERYEFKNFEGKDNIFNLSNSIYNEIEEELDIIDKLLIAVDADDPKDSSLIRGYKITEDSLKELITNLDFEIDIDYFIFNNGDKESGYLESYLLSVLDDAQQECIENFKSCYKYDLSDKFVFNTFYKQKRHPFDFSHQNFDELKVKLKNLFE